MQLETTETTAIMRTQISTNVSLSTRAQADELIEKRGYSMRDVVTIAIRKLHEEEFPKMDNYELLQNMEQAAEISETGIVAVESDDNNHYFTFTSQYTAPKNWARLGKWSQRLYPSGETVPELVIEIKNWIEEF